MNTLPVASVSSRFTAFAAAVVVTLTILSGIDAMALAQSASAEMAQTGLAQPA